ncbi:hypothetical protein BDY21DRAFT_355637 [Lineolata rhizophorae]|uniref:Uncharacterized protein n=1 Tax=Lineolata rhizophorae TaxID=578093 RepID=A0A6A6NPJ4_9PEZI|nr:hypothetical protein BDY21DRAFT_355637 [Lineolata rhizophorae]
MWSSCGSSTRSRPQSSLARRTDTPDKRPEHVKAHCPSPLPAQTAHAAPRGYHPTVDSKKHVGPSEVRAGRSSR